MPSPGDPLAAEIAALGTWLRTRAWSVWLAHGIDAQHGAFHEHLNDALHCVADHRRLRVAARQIVAFSAAAREDRPGAAQAVRLGLDFLQTHARHAAGAYVSRFALNNSGTGTERDTYDLAFVLLAFAAAADIVPEQDLRGRALELLAWMESALAHEHGGWHEGIPANLPRRQNPQMHMLEALHACHRAFADEIFLRHAADIVSLFLRRLQHAETGALPEYFDAAWNLQTESGAFRIEPGHHCEWVWLLHDHAALAGADPRLAQAAASLMRFVDRYGHAPAGGLANLVNSRGEILDAQTRLWPQAERLKAELLRPDPDPGRQIDAARQLARRLRPNGLWHEHLPAAPGQPSPATSLYHVTGAILAAESWLTAAH